ncbi:hypothetical protein LOD99_8480 [Oopsacas minuta]|uniref:Uncharacterized protein n=1 Tax=Oopsacas minuta TaxID=111878 RepID=A0AAV7JGB1_9METZ|nr:hypothetical protein LOD99_8480 [Oopsacas minuta]
MTDGSATTNDIGTVIGKTAELSDHDRLNLLNNAFVSSIGFDWPYQNRTSKGKVEKLKYLSQFLLHINLLEFNFLITIICRQSSTDTIFLKSILSIQNVSG